MIYFDIHKLSVNNSTHECDLTWFIWKFFNACKIINTNYDCDDRLFIRFLQAISCDKIKLHFCGEFSTDDLCALQNMSMI